MTKMSPTNAAALLADARIQMHRLPELPAHIRPEDQDAAYACQAELVPLLLKHFGGAAIGYKIACTNEIAQRQLSVNGPFFGRLLAATTQESPGRIHASRYFMRVMEAEFAFRMAHDLPPAGVPRTREQVADAVEGVLPGIEVVDSRFDSWTTVGTPSLIADNACHAAWIRGAIVRDWRSLDLAAQKVRLVINGELKDEGSGAAVLGHPLNALQWLANALNERGLGLRAGDYITTGVTTDIYLAGPGDHVAADFGNLGRVELTIE
jgi:2-keto-4-pentenoate hydratase